MEEFTYTATKDGKTITGTVSGNSKEAVINSLKKQSLHPIIVKKKKSKNFVALVTERRMKAASDLLLCTSMKIFEISQKCGYSDQHYFSYCFKKYYGVSPSKYREERLGGKDI